MLITCRVSLSLIFLLSCLTQVTATLNTPSNTINSSSSTNNTNSATSSTCVRNSTALQRIQAIVEYLHERHIDLEDLCDLRRQRLEECVQFAQLDSDANQVLRWMGNGESMLTASFSIPICLKDAEELLKEHEKFQLAIEKTHSSAYQLQLRAESMLQADHFNSEGILAIRSDVSNKWNSFMTHAEDRHKLVMSSVSFYRTVEQVIAVLDSLEKQYTTEEDFCGASQVLAFRPKHSSPVNSPTGINSNNIDAIITLLISSSIEIPESTGGDKKIALIITKHQEQKDAFLKACTLARRNADSFYKYASRCVQYYLSRVSNSALKNAKSKIDGIIEQISKQEDTVLTSWSTRKKRLDHCQQYILVEHTARQALKWIKEVGEQFIITQYNLLKQFNKTSGNNNLSSSTSNDNCDSSNSLSLEDMYKNMGEFRNEVTKTKEKVKLLLQLSDNLIDKGQVHSASIKFWCNLVKSSFREYVRKLDQYQLFIEEMLGLRQPSTSHGLASSTINAFTSSSNTCHLTSTTSTSSHPGDRSSDSSLESKISIGKDSISSLGSNYLTSSSGLPSSQFSSSHVTSNAPSAGTCSEYSASIQVTPSSLLVSPNSTTSSTLSLSNSKGKSICFLSSLALSPLCTVTLINCCFLLILS